MSRSSFSRAFCTVLLLPLLLPETRAQSLQVYIHHFCSGMIDRFESGSTFEANLNSILSSFSSLNQTSNGFYNLSVGQHEDQVNSIALCRGDVNETLCLECIKFGATDLLPRCSAQMGAIIWYDNCMFRFTNWYFFRSVEGTYTTFSSSLTSSDTETFNRKLFPLLKILRDKASSGNATLKFAVGDTHFSGSERIYGLVQCSPDLDQMQCANCLDRAFRDITKFIPGRAGGRVLGPSCSLRFEMSQFYEDKITLPTPKPEASSPSRPKATRRRILIIVVSAVSAVLILS